uniref:efflux RND transporter periplasmic adaptor subunit n=1 Tax=Ningiella ruwaisensis TaxID=2364274 RepID=UPI0010A08FC2|nr:efflux RND transporter periplasmic adaptor subunit [Ningiella ruwaisensis]
MRVLLTSFSALSACVLLSALLLANSASANSANPVPVFVAQAVNQNLNDEIEALGSLQANENVNLTSTVTERVIQVNFDDNQSVKKGDLLAVMDFAQEEAELAEEQSRLDEAKRQINRLRPLVEEGVASSSALDVQEREVNTARARIKAIESRINERRIIAPFDGVVGIRNISVGALVQPGTLITTIDDISVMKLDFSIPEVYLSALERGISVRATSSAYPGRVFTGTITSIDSRVDPVTRAVLSRALIDNEEGLLKAGMLMQVVLKANPRKALVVPEEALIVLGNKKYVMRVEEDANGEVIAKRTQVELGLRLKGEIEIISGLEEGERVVTHGTLRISDGAKVSVRAIEDNNQSLQEMLAQSQMGAES